MFGLPTILKVKDSEQVAIYPESLKASLMASCIWHTQILRFSFLQTTRIAGTESF